MSDRASPTGSAKWLMEIAADRRFGGRDRRGRANLIAPLARRRAIASMRTGEPISLSRPVTPARNIRDDAAPGFEMQRFREQVGRVALGSEHLRIDCHGTTNTHLDAFNHLGLHDSWYSGWSLDEMDECGVQEFATSPLFTRGVVADIPAVRGTDWVDAAQPVSGEDIDAALRMEGLEFEPGDALLLYMGRDRFEVVHGPYSPPVRSSSGEMGPGVGADGAAWILDHDVSVLAWDFADARHPDEHEGSVHGLIWACGLLIVDNCDFSRVAHPGAPREGALIISPLMITGATGSLVNPLFII